MPDADVVVIGAGVGGMSAALVASAAGARVLLIEKTDRLGGNAAISSGYMAFAGSAPQAEEGIADSPADLYDDMAREVDLRRHTFGIDFDDKLAWLFAEESAESYRFLEGLGVRFGRFVPRPTQHRIQRLLGIAVNDDFRACFESALVAAGVEIRTRTELVRLVTTGGRVTGAVIRPRNGGTTSTVEAGRAVILATGGYQANHDLRRHYQPEEMAVTGYPGLDTCRGDGHVAAQAIGADLINMTMIPTYIRAPSGLIEDVIALNREGKRFHDEAGPYFDRVEALRLQPNNEGYYVISAATRKKSAALIDGLPSAAVELETLLDVATHIGAPAEAVRATIDDWNVFIFSDSDRDPWFGRVVLPSPRAPIAAPYLVAPMVLAATLTAGGARVSPRLEVIDVYGDVIPGLYAVGDMVGGVNPAAGVGGLHISSAVTFGRLAGAAAAS